MTEEPKPVLHVYRGLPGSGKTSQAKLWRQQDARRRVLASRDDFRSMFAGERTKLSEFEDVITRLEREAVRQLLRDGISVGLHDTNLRRRGVREWLALAESEGASWQVEDLTGVPLEEVLWRNSTRHWREQVPEEVIRRKHERYIKSQGDPSEIEWTPTGSASKLEVEPYERPICKPRAYIFDIDGNLSSMVDRGPHEYHRVDEDEVRGDVRALLLDLHSAGNEIILMSGRPESCRGLTEQWMKRHGIPYRELLMRSNEEQKAGIADDVVKLRLFNERVRHRYSVVAAVDDRDRIVKLWRDLGITCLQSAPGAF